MTDHLAAISQIARALGVDRRTVGLWCATGSLKSATKLGGRNWLADPREVKRVFHRKLRVANRKPRPGRPFRQHPRAAKEEVGNA